MRSLKLQLPAPVAGHQPVIDELKGLAIILVILYHAGGVLVWQNLLHGDIGVDIFVILSGVGLSLGSGYRGARDFFLRRFSRIYPAYWLVLTVYLFGNIHFLQHHYSASNIVLHYLGLHGWFGDVYAMSINDSFWFVTLIVSLYVLYALFQPISLQIDRLLLCGAVVSVVAAFAFFLTGQSGCFGHIALRIPGFFVGWVVGRLLRHGQLELPLTGTMALALFLIAYVPYTHGVVFHSVVVGACVMMAYIYAWKNWLPAEAEHRVARVLKFFGDYSFEIFLIHQPLIREYNFYLHGRWFNIPSPSPTSLTVGMIVGLAVTLVLSVELHRLQQKAFSRTRTS